MCMTSGEKQCQLNILSHKMDSFVFLISYYWFHCLRKFISIRSGVQTLFNVTQFKVMILKTSKLIDFGLLCCPYNYYISSQFNDNSKYGHKMRNPLSFRVYGLYYI